MSAGPHRVNYVMATYFGDRQVGFPAYEADRSFFLRRHLESLTRLEHELAQITVVASGDDPKDFLLDLPDRIRNTPVVTLRRPNEGLSYGAYSDAFEIWGEAFDSFLFVEDDYVFTHDHFDALLLDELGARPSCGQLCGAVFHNLAGLLGEMRNDPFASVAISICKSAALRKARINSFGSKHRLYYEDTPVYNQGCLAQMRQSFAILDAGYTVEDWLSRWSTAYWESSTSSVFWFGDPEKRALVVPVQCVDRPDQIIGEREEWKYGRPYRGVIDERGGKRSA